MVVLAVIGLGDRGVGEVMRLLGEGVLLIISIGIAVETSMRVSLS